MALQHARSGEPLDVQPFGAALPGQKTTALFKSAQLEVMRLVLMAGKALPPHQMPGEVTIQCIEGELDVTVAGESHRLAAGQLLFLEGGTPHGVVALRDASALVTLVLPQP
ncbi:cupin domain-containing protein [Aquincola sp. MAHUQ-54]|uniref:Cupin domain-containing protein n=1 Tax=Aquincola agrisoli TaxID=3119538 RepID=A0AAW9QL27_9BURK